MKTQCAWCTLADDSLHFRVMRDGKVVPERFVGASHGVCAGCSVRVRAQYALARLRKKAPAQCVRGRD